MKKIFFLIGTAFLCQCAFAQTDFNPPTKDIEWFGDNTDYSDAENAERRTGIRGSERNAPIGSATLLLLGLGGTTVGIRVLTSKKK